MVSVKFGKHNVELYDSIEELPIVRFHKYQKLLLVEAGIGGDIAAFDQRIEKTRRYLLEGKTEAAAQELENMRQGVYFIQNEVSPRSRAFAMLVAKIDGEAREDLSDDGISRTLELLQDTPLKQLTDRLEAVKKKIDRELTLYFPALFNGSEVKEYYDLMRRRALAVLENIIAGVARPDETDEVEKLTTALVCYSHPQSFVGSEGVEVQYERQFENLCLALSERLHVEPKRYTVMEFYNAFDFLRERTKQAEKAQKQAISRR